MELRDGPNPSNGTDYGELIVAAYKLDSIVDINNTEFIYKDRVMPI